MVDWSKLFPEPDERTRADRRAQLEYLGKRVVVLLGRLGTVTLDERSNEDDLWKGAFTDPYGGIWNWCLCGKLVEFVHRTDPAFRTRSCLVENIPHLMTSWLAPARRRAFYAIDGRKPPENV